MAKSILIVEDNDDMRAYIKSYLIHSYNIIEASNGKEGAEKAREKAIVTLERVYDKVGFVLPS